MTTRHGGNCLRVAIYSHSSTTSEQRPNCKYNSVVGHQKMVVGRRHTEITTVNIAVVLVAAVVEGPSHGPLPLTPTCFLGPDDGASVGLCGLQGDTYIRTRRLKAHTRGLYFVKFLLASYTYYYDHYYYYHCDFNYPYYRNLLLNRVVTCCYFLSTIVKNLHVRASHARRSFGDIASLLSKRRSTKV